MNQFSFQIDSYDEKQAHNKNATLFIICKYMHFIKFICLPYAFTYPHIYSAV